MNTWMTLALIFPHPPEGVTCHALPPGVARNSDGWARGAALVAHAPHAAGLMLGGAEGRSALAR